MRSGKRNHEEEVYEEDDFGTRKEGPSSSTTTNTTKEGKSNVQKANAIRSKHSVTEQRRRSKINERFQILRDLIPHSDQKRDTASFLLEVIEYVRYIQEKVQTYEGSYQQGWSPEPTKLMPWRNSHWRAQSIAGHAQPSKNGSGSVGPTVSGKFDESYTPTMLSSAQDLVDPGLGGSAIFTPTDHLAIPMPFQATSSGSVQIENMHAHAVRRPDSDAQPIGSATIGNILNQRDDIMIEGGTISISNVYSQELLNSLTQALQNAGVDISQVNLSVQIDLGKRRTTQHTSGTFPAKDHESCLPTEAGSREISDQAQKRRKT